MPTDHNIWTCAETETRFSDFVDGLLAPDERAAFDRHRAGCAACATLSARVAATVSGLHAMPMLEAPPELVRAILARTSGAHDAECTASAAPGTQSARTKRRWLEWLSALAQPRFAYGVLSVLVSALVVSHALGIEWRRPTTADLDPANIYRTANRQGHLIYARGTKFVADSRIVYEIQSALDSEPAAESAPQQNTAPSRAPAETPSHAPGQTRIVPPAGPRDPERAGRPADFMSRAVTRTASLMLSILVRPLP